MGNSGGGTLTTFLAALDERITAASPSCYITSMQALLERRGPPDGPNLGFGPPDAEQNLYGQKGDWNCFDVGYREGTLVSGPRCGPRRQVIS